MHMADSLLSPEVGITMCAVSALSIGVAIKKVKTEDLAEKKLPLMAVAGAFIFAAQMINIAIPGTGSSGHIGGGILLASLLGPFSGLLTISVVLIIQSLFFADGGLIALGCNIFNMGVIPCLVVYPVVFKPFLKKEITNTRITIASIISVVLALQLGAFAVVLQTVASKITQLPFGAFCAAMLPIHLAIGLLEGVITAFVLIPVFKMRPEILESVQKNIPLKEKISVKNVIIAFGVVAAIVGIVFSFFASGKPDGLEWSMEKVAGTAELETTAPLFESAAKVQEGLSFLPDYNFKNAEEKSQGIQIFGTSFSGLVGMILTFAFAALIAVAITYSKKKISAKSTK